MNQRRVALLEKCHNIIDTAHQFPTNNTLKRLISLLSAEASFLSRLDTTDNITPFITASNVPFLVALWDALTFSSDPLHLKLLEPLSDPSGTIRKIDVIDGDQWIKIRAMANPSTLHRDLARRLNDLVMLNEHSNISIEQLEQQTVLNMDLFQTTREWIQLAQHHQLPNGRPPIVILRLVFSATAQPATHLVPPVLLQMFTQTTSPNERLAIQVQIGSSRPLTLCLVDHNPIDPPFPSSKRFLDVTTLIAMCSDTTHRLPQIPLAAFDVPALLHQAQNEQQLPFWHLISPWITNAECYTTDSALLKFAQVTHLIAGDHEKARAIQLFHLHDLQRLSLVDTLTPQSSLSTPIQMPLKVNVIPDDPSPSFQHLMHKPLPKKVNLLHLNLFGTADHHNAPILTSNHHLAQMLICKDWWRSQGHWRDALPVVHVHPPRSYIETRWQRHVSL